MDVRESELRADSRSMLAVYRPELSYKPESLNLSKTRFVDIATYRVKVGNAGDLGVGVRETFVAYTKGNVDVCVLAYEVVAGAPSGTFLFFTMADSLKFLDHGMAHEKVGLRESDRFVSIENNLFEVTPGMSLPAKAVAEGDPAFWKPKATSSKQSNPVSIPGPPEKSSNWRGRVWFYNKKTPCLQWPRPTRSRATRLSWGSKSTFSSPPLRRSSAAVPRGSARLRTLTFVRYAWGCRVRCRS
ncbi:MAG: hypothetical protein WDO73_08390 [Ignavibacteriota bacterium]